MRSEHVGEKRKNDFEVVGGEYPDWEMSAHVLSSTQSCLQFRTGQTVDYLPWAEGTRPETIFETIFMTIFQERH
jgi:hypothetical protein